MKKKLLFCLVLLFSAVMLFAGGSSEADSTVVKIGVFEPASGDNGAGGKQETLGIQYANYLTPTVMVGDTEYTVELVVADNESSNDRAATAAATLVNADVSVALGSYGSGVSIAGSDTFRIAGVPIVGITCTNPQVTEGNTHYFRICYLDPFQGTVLANYAYDTLGARKVYCLAKLGDDYSGGLVNYFIERFTSLGGEVVSETFPDGNSDFTSYIANAKNSGCEVFFSPVSTEAAQLIINQAQSQGLGMPILAGDTWDSNVILQAAKGTDVDVTVTTFYPEGADPEFDEGFKSWVNADSARLSNNGGDDTVAAVTAMGFDAYYFVLQAIQNAASIDPADVMEALWGTEIDGVTGHIALEQVNGDAIRNTVYVKHANTETGGWDALPAVVVD